MPIVFIVNGIFLLFIIFKIGVLKNDIILNRMICFSIIFFLSFFSSTIMIGDIFVNPIEVFAIVFLALNFNCKTIVSIRNIIIILFSSIIYYHLLNVSFNSQVNNVYLIYCISLLGGLLSHNKDSGLLILILSLIMIFINLKFELNEYTFSLLNFQLVIESILIYYLFNAILSLIDNFICQKGRGFYVKKTWNNFLSINWSNSYLSYKLQYGIGK